MHIKEIVIDGFKSYAHRTVINGFDPHFNAITGLNGSGKSNILDAICFLLGITNLSQVRAGNLSELVYKQGQAGVNKASVTIVFDNEEESKSPVGYEQCAEVTVTRQVLLGGKSKYLVNGRVAAVGQVQNLFHSVQLNVNNPHFLIMQGRITKVLNMKPTEILGMVEETAGTRMYEMKKNSALKTIEKKQTKVDEINSILSEEITPKLEKLRNEKQHYLKWSKNNADIERIERFVVASEFLNARNTLSKNNDEISEMTAKITTCQESLISFEADMKAKEAEIKELSSKMSEDFEARHAAARKNEEELAKEFVKATSSYDNSTKVSKTALEDLASAKALVEETLQLVTDKEIEIENHSDNDAQQEAADAEKEVKRLQEEYQNMCAGISEGDETLPDQISKAHSDSKAADARIKQAKMKIDHLSKTLKTVQKDMDAQAKSSEALSQKKDKIKSKVADLQNKLDHLNFSSNEFNALDAEKVILENSVAALQEKVDTLNAQLQGRLAFEYSDPVRGFDRNKVKGLVARLVTVKNDKYSTALEVAAGGKLYQVIVDEAIAGKALLDKGQLKRRVTIIPLDKIQGRRVSSSICEEASALANKLGSSASAAIELVGFHEEIRNAIEYVFGATLVVDEANSANKICDLLKTRTVTQEGDVYDPSGTISGGSKNNLGTTLSKLSELAVANSELTQKRSRLEKIQSKLTSLQSMSKKYEDFSGQLELATAELVAVEKHLSQTTYGMLCEKAVAMAKEVEDAELEMKNMRIEKECKWSLYQDLKEREAELTKTRENKFKDIEARIKIGKERVAKASKKALEASSRCQTLSLELEDLRKELAASKVTAAATEKALFAANSNEAKRLIELKEVTGRFDEAKAIMKATEGEIRKCSTELKALTDEKAALDKQAEATKLEIKKLGIQVAKYEKEQNNAERNILSMLQKHAWIESENDAFGVSGSDYDFEKSDPTEMGSKLRRLKEEQASLAKKINKKVMGMLEKTEGECTELIRKRKVITNDKMKIQAFVEELDIKKKAELERTWKKVNRDFGSIFSTLLPGTSAKLEPPEGLQPWEGLEVKVAFGDVWKQSLTELSGGQRSLLALSLILSLLLFKPAPMYILDEVDAALDLSHTQNIGNMLKTHFSQSQFIVVSLKVCAFVVMRRELNTRTSYFLLTYLKF